jgi:hypothetical protein
MGDACVFMYVGIALDCVFSIPNALMVSLHTIHNFTLSRWLHTAWMVLGVGFFLSSRWPLASQLAEPGPPLPTRTT